MKYFSLRALRKLAQWIRGYRFNRAKRRAIYRRPWLEPLENRIAPAAYTWNNPAGGNWDVVGNWTVNSVVATQLPGPSDTAVINTGSAATITIQSIDTNLSVLSLTTGSNDLLKFTGGSLTIGANSTLSGALTMTSGTLTASGTGVTLSCSGTTTVSGASLYAEGGATLSLPNLTTYTETDSTVFQATGTNSTLNLSALHTLGSMTSFWQVEALNGGTVNLSDLATVSEANANVQFDADGGGSQLASQIDLNDLTSFTGGGGSSEFKVVNGATITATLLTSFSDVQITLDGSVTGNVATSQWSNITGDSSLTVTGGTYSFSALTGVSGSSATGSRFYAEDGATLGLPNLTTYTETDSTVFEATGTSSVLNVSALTTLGSMTSFWQVEALNGGTVNLSGLATVNEPSANIQFDADGGNSQLPSQIDLPDLTTFTGGGGSSEFKVLNGATITATNLTSFTDVQITLDGTGTVATSQWSKITGDGSITVTGGAYSFTGITGVNGSSASGSSFYAESGGTLGLPNLTTYTETDSTVFEATGTSSVLNVSALTTLGSMTSFWQVEALNGGTVNLSGLATVSEPNANIQFDADGGNSQLPSQIDLPDLTTFTGGGGSSEFKVLNGATITATNLTSFTDVQITLDGTGTVATSQWSNITGDGSITVTGGAYSFTGITGVSGSSASGSSFEAESGGTLGLPNLTTYTETDSTVFEATGTSSVLNVSALTTLGSMTSFWQVEALNGGTVNLSGLATVSEPNANIQFDADGGNSQLPSQIDLPDLTTFTGGGGSSEFKVLNGATITATNLTSFTDVQITLDGTGTVATNQWSNLTSASSLTVTGGTYSFTDLTGVSGSSVNGSSFYAEGGGTLGLPNLTTYTETDSTVFEATGANSTLNVSALTTLGSMTSFWQVEAINGGTVNLSDLATVNEPNANIQFNADGGNSQLASQIDLNDLTSFTGGGGSSEFKVVNSGTISATSLTSFSDVQITLDGTGTVATGQWSNLTNDSSITVTGGTISFIGLTGVSGSSASGSSFEAEDGGTLGLPNLTTYTETDSTVFEATGANSVLNVSALTTLGSMTGFWQIEALNGGTVNLSALATVDEPNANVQFDADGGNSQLASEIELPDLTSFTGGGGSSELKVVNGATILAGSLTSFSDIQFTLNGTGTVATSLWSSITGGSNLTISAGSYSLPDLGDITGSTLAVKTGGSLTVAGLTSVSGATIDDTGSSTLVDANLTTLNDVTLETDGTDSQVGNAWTSFTNGTLTVTAGTLTLPALTDFANSNLQLSGGAALSLPVLQEGNIALTNGTSVTIQGVLVALPASGTSGTTISVPASAGLTITLQNSGTLTNMAFDVGQGSNLVLAGGTYLGNTSFSVGLNGTVDLSGGQTSNYGGTLTGSGLGMVQVRGGEFNPTLGGITLDFPNNMFQWTGGAMFAALGNVTNQGTINLAGSSDKGFYEDATLDNFGTIIQTGTGNLGLHSDNVSATTLKIESGAYLIESDSGIDNPYGGDTALINAGTIRKTSNSGSGTSTLDINGTLSNTGTIEVDAGTMTLDASSVNQVSSGTLTAGTWNALGGSLQFPSGTVITSNAAHISLSGSGVAIAGISGLASNSGTFSIAGAADFTTAGAFSNSGSLTVGPSSTLTVHGTFAQTAAGTLNVQIGGAPISGLFGDVAVTGAATLAGDFNVELVNSYSPPVGVVYQVMSFASSSGTFARITGLPSGMTATTTATALNLAIPVTGADLVVSNISAPTGAISGQSITVTWQVTNQSTIAATGNWQDSVYVSATPAITSSSTLLGAVEHSGGLSTNATYDGTLTAPLPALPPGSYYIIVQVDSLYQVADQDRANTTADATTGQIGITVPALTLNGTSTSGSFTAAGENQYYQVNVPAGGSLAVALTSNANSGGTALYISQGVLPTPYNYQDGADVPNQPNQTVAVPQVLSAGTYYILAQSIAGAAATAGYSLAATSSAAVTISGISPNSGGNAGNVTIEIDGANFTPSANTTATLSPTGVGFAINASAIDFVNAGQLFATFDLNTADPGSYDLTVAQSGHGGAAAPTTFQVQNVAPSFGGLIPPEEASVVVSTPQYVRSGRTGTITITYSNLSSNDIVAPLLEISSTNSAVTFSTPDDPNNFTDEAEVLATASSGPAGILRPGQSGQLTLALLSNDKIANDAIPVQVTPLQTETLVIGIDYVNYVSPTIDWAAQEASLQPSNIPTAAWSVIYNNLVNIVGSTTADYNAALAQAATYLGNVGATPAQLSDVTTLWSFLVAQANATFPTAALASAIDASLPIPGSLSLAINRTFNSSISGRSTAGIFGLGWTTPWQSSLSADSAGNVTIDTGGVLNFFPRLPNGDYADTDGEYGALTESAGVFTFTNSSGTQYVYLPTSGLLSYEEDTSGNRITLGYNSQDQLISLTYSNPSDMSEPSESLTLTYTQGFVTKVTDSAGASWTYTYDSTGHLLSVVAPGPTAAGLTTTYTYGDDGFFETQNALTSITNPDGSEQNFSYSLETGQLIATSQNGGVDPISYTYQGEGEITATDSNDHQTTVWYNNLGLPARVQNALGGVSTYLYDNNGNLVSYTDAAGDTYQYSYDQNGNLIQTVNPLGQTVQMTYNSLSDLTSITDAENNTTDYSYNSAGNLLSIAYPDGTQQSFTYNPLGNVSETILQNGDPISYQYNSQGLVSQETFAGNSSETFTYDGNGNLLTAKTFSSTGTLTGTTTLSYNAANELTSVSYPGGLSLTYTYNAQGQRMTSIDQTGYTLTYSYDAEGRLTGLSDGSGMVVAYYYNEVGLLAEKNNNNGTFTTYGYDGNGNLTSEVNYAPSIGTPYDPATSAVNSSFRYTYNALNEMTSMTDANDNVTQYAYDATGQLTQVTLPGGPTITYVYNAAGDRTEVINDSTPTTYSSNSANEITQVGTATYTYDANGNLASVTDSSGTTTYTYNDLNQLVSVAAPGDVVTTYQYSPLGFLVGTDVAGTQTNYLVDPTGLGNVVSSYEGGGSLIAHYDYGLGLAVQTGAGVTGYYDFDAGGNTIGITGSSGSYVNQYTYLPFGETTTIGTPQLPNPFTFAGQYGVMQTASNLFYMRARNYAPSTGQFLSSDPTGLAGGDTNLRRYVNNAPTDDVDPLGLQNGGGNAGAQGILNFFTGDQYGNSYAARAKAQQDAINSDDPAAAAEALRNANQNLQNATPSGTANLFKNTSFANPLNQFFADGKIAPPDLGDLKETGKGILKSILSALSIDPNALVGPAGVGTENFVPLVGTLPYTVDFENDGTVAAQDVTVTEQLNANLDWSTFQLGSFGFGPINVTVPADLTQYQTTVSYENSDGTSLNVQVSLDFSVATGLLAVTFVSLDPNTGAAPTGVFDGFLPPDNSSHIGEGYVQYAVQANTDLATGTQITQEPASVVFDTNAPLDTNTVTNTIDAGPPTSSVAPLASTSLPSFTVSWSGQDDSGGSGIASFTIYDSVNAGPYQLWQSATTATSAVFTGVAGNTYAFYSVATDNVGNVQPTPLTAQATTTVNADIGVTTNPSSQTVAVGQNVTFTAAGAGTPKPTEQWQVSADDGTTWTNIPGAVSTTLTVMASQALNGNLYRAVFTSSAGQAVTNVATLTVNFTEQATTKPQALTVAAGTSVMLTAAATSDPVPTVQWMSSTNNGKTFSPITGATLTSYSFTAQIGDTGNLYEAVFTNGIGKPVATAAITLTVDAAAPAVITSPTAQSAAVGGTATFTASGSGTPTPTVQWQVSSDDGHTYSDIAGATKTTLTLSKLTAAQDGGLYRAVFTNAVGQATTTTALLTVQFAPIVTQQPTNQTAAASTQVTFTAASSAEPAATVQWMVSTNAGKNYSAITGATLPSYSFTAEAGDSGNLYEAVFTNGIGSPATTKAASLTIAVAPGVQANPTNQTAVNGAATFSVTPTGSTPKVQWQFSSNGGTIWSNVAGATSASLALKGLTGTEDQWRYRVLVTNALGSFTSDAATLTVHFAPLVTLEPISQAATVGAQVTFAAAANADPTATVQWMLSTNGGKNYSAITGATSPSYSLTVESADNGHMFEAVFTNGIGKAATTTPATLTIAVAPGVVANPLNQLAANGAATFSVVPTGTSPKVQWQVRTHGGTTWTNVVGATSANLTLKGLTTANDQSQYRVLVTNALGTFTSGAATLTVHFAPTVTKQPTSQTAATGTKVTFTAAASAEPPATVQWMVSTNGGKTYSAIAGAITTSYSFIAQAGESGNLYEAVFTNDIGKATTTAASLTIAVPPGVQANPTSKTAVSGAATFSVVPTGTTPKVQWQVSTNGGTTWSNLTGATSASLALAGLTGAEDHWQYRVLVTNALGTFTSGAATLTVLYGPVISA